MAKAVAVPVAVPVADKYMLSIEEAAAYFRIGENKLRDIARENPLAPWLFWNGNRAQIKRRLFEQFLDESNTL